MVHGICFNDNILSCVQLNICSRHKEQTTFSGQKTIGRRRGKSTVVDFFLEILLFAPWEIFSAFLLSADFFQNAPFEIKTPLKN